MLQIYTSSATTRNWWQFKVPNACVLSSMLCRAFVSRLDFAIYTKGTIYLIMEILMVYIFQFITTNLYILGSFKNSHSSLELKCKLKRVALFYLLLVIACAFGLDILEIYWKRCYMHIYLWCSLIHIKSGI